MIRIEVAHDATDAQVSDIVQQSGVRGAVEIVRKLPPRSAWTWAWLAWLLLFLAIELPAAVREHGEPSGKAWKTLSRHVWRWFPTWPRRAVLSAFWIALGAHFVFGASALWLLTAVPLVGAIAYAEFFERSR